MKLVKDTDNKIIETSEVTDKEAEQAFKTILVDLEKLFGTKVKLVVLHKR